MGEHFIEKCVKCGDVINQCRCMAQDKKVEWGICEKCKTKKGKINEFYFPTGKRITLTDDELLFLRKELDGLVGKEKDNGAIPNLFDRIIRLEKEVKELSALVTSLAKRVFDDDIEYG